VTELTEVVPIQEILDVVGVQRVVAIDDVYADKAPVADAISAINAVLPEVAAAILTELTEVDFTGDSEIRDKQIRDSWPTIQRKRKVQIIQELRAKASEIDDTDKVTKDSLETVFGARDFNPLSLEDWNASKNEILKDKSLLLILIDEDFSNEGGTQTQGLDIVREILSSTSATEVICALLSHKYSHADVHSQWQTLCAQQGFDKSRFVLIPKSTIDDDPAAFARLIKLATIAKPMDQLRAVMSEIVLTAFVEASEKLEQIDIYDMDEIIFRSSWREGVWEPETLLRVFALFHKTRARALALGNDDLHFIASKVRKVSHVATDSVKQPEHKIWPIQHLEIYDDSAYLNALHLPIELGDIFEKQGGKQFILIGPPCDLMVRSKGQRTESIKEVVLAEVTTEERRNVTWELPYFSRVEKHYVDFKKAFSVKLFGLDLCVFNEDGSASLTVAQDKPKNLIPAWAGRYAKLQDEVAQIFADMATKPGNDSRGLLEKLIGRIDHSGVFAPTLQYSTKTIRYNFKRVGRLMAPRSNALMTAYAQFLARSAFEHDLERTETWGRLAES
jgi:hypothetical protein